MSELQEARERLAAAKSVAVLSGAGVSAESGVPTFRGEGGLWRNYSAMDLATPEAFARDPQLVWEWYDWRRGLIGACEPNDGHRGLVRLEERLDQFALITQNVDGLHGLAGSRNLLELHGNIWVLRCTECGRKREDRTHPLALLPHCGECRGLERPHIVWFGESLDSDLLDGAARAAAACDVFLVVGTSGVVQPAASLAYRAKRGGAYVIVVNLEETTHTRDMDAALIGRAGDVLNELV